MMIVGCICGGIIELVVIPAILFFLGLMGIRFKFRRKNCEIDDCHCACHENGFTKEVSED